MSPILKDKFEQLHRNKEGEGESTHILPPTEACTHTQTIMDTDAHIQKAETQRWINAHRRTDTEKHTRAQIHTHASKDTCAG